MTSFWAAWASLDEGRYRAELYRMWYAGYRAGLPHSRTLASVGAFRRAPTIERYRRHLAEGTARGEDVATLLESVPALVMPFEAGLLTLGEQTGALEKVLKALGDYFQTDHRMVLSIKRRMAYTMVNAVAAIVIVPLPLVLAGLTVTYLLTVLLALALAATAGGGLVLAIVRRYRAKPRFALGRLLRALTLGVEAGLPLDRVVTLGVAAAGDPALAAHVAGRSARDRGAQPLAVTFRGAPLIPPEVRAALTVADASGDYDGTLRKLADLYDGRAGGARDAR